MVRRSIWMLALAAGLTAAPLAAAPPASAAMIQGKARVQAQPEATRAFDGAYMQAIALQGALAQGDWADAKRRIDAIRSGLDAVGAAPGLKSAVAPMASDADRVAQAVSAKDVARASSAAYDLVGRFASGVDQVAWSGGLSGGGGGGGGEPAPSGQNALDHVEASYQSAASAQLLVAEGDQAGAKLALKQVKHHLDTVSDLGGVDPSKIAELRLRVDGIDATLGTERAAPQARALVLAFADVFRSATGGGGGPARPVPFKGDAVPRMGGGAGSATTGDATSDATGNAADDTTPMGRRDPNDASRDRPNQSGRQ